MLGEDILSEIDSTLDRLIQNAEAFQKVEPNTLSEFECDAFQKTQESLLHHLIHMNQFLETKRETIKTHQNKNASCELKQKLAKFEKIRSSCTQKRHRSLILSKRRSKKIFGNFSRTQ